MLYRLQLAEMNFTMEEADGIPANSCSEPRSKDLTRSQVERIEVIIVKKSEIRRSRSKRGPRYTPRG